MAKPPYRPARPPGVLHITAGRRPARSSGPRLGPVIGGMLILAGGAYGVWWLKQNQPTLERTTAMVEDPVPDLLPQVTAPAPSPSAPGPVLTQPSPVPAPASASVDPAPAPVALPAPASLFNELLVLDELAGSKASAVTARQAALDLALSSGAWSDYRELLGRSLQAWLAPRFKSASADAAAVVFENPLASEALLRHAFLSAAETSLGSFAKNNPAAPGFLRWLLTTPEAMQSFTLTLTEKDNPAAAFKIWSDIVEEDSLARTTYRELALACALVFDQRSQVRWNNYPLRINPMERYRFYRDNAEAGRLTGKIQRMSAAELVWVVCAPVPQSELEWALKQADWKQRTWGAAYGSIKYDMDKAVSGKSKDPYSDYTLAEIAKKGGICGDQAYFSANTARAHGIPASIVSGDGPRGGHAWLVWLAQEGEWEFAGRFSGYPAGHTGHPQSDVQISEDEFVRANDRKASDPDRVRRANQYLWLAALFTDEPLKAEALIVAASKSAPHLPEAAAAGLRHWIAHRQSDPVADWVKFLAGLRKDFRDHSLLMTMAKSAEEQYVFARQDSKTALRTLKREAGKVEDTKGADAGVAPDSKRVAESFRRQAEVLISQKDLDGVRGIYRRALSEHGSDPALFKALGRDFYKLVSTDAPTAVKACQDLEAACRRYVGKGGGDWFDITSQNSAWKVVADCYRKAGDPDKASRIERAMQQRQDDAKRKAI